MAAINVTDLSNAKLDVDHIADVANSTLPTAIDRLGNIKDTVKGAVDTLKAFNSRGAWVTATAYAVKDLVTNGGQWYVCVTAHTSSAAFATDSANWRVHQGVTSAELALSSASAGIGFIQAGTGAVSRTQQDKARDTLHARDYGVVGDGITDDYPNFLVAIAACKALKKPLDISDLKIYLASQNASINVDDVLNIKGSGKLPKPDLDIAYINGADNAMAMWNASKVNEGSAIFSRYNGPMFTGKVLPLQDLTLFCDYIKPLSKFFAQTTVTTYPGWSQALPSTTRFSAYYCGSDGITLTGGLELCELRGIEVWFCGGYALNIGMTVGINCPIEYLHFDESCSFIYGRLGNVWLNGFRRHVKFEGCLVNAAGQYDVQIVANPSFTVASQTAIVPPIRVTALAAGVYGGVNHTGSDKLEVERCYTEVSQGIVQVDGAPINSVEVKRNTLIPWNNALPKNQLSIRGQVYRLRTASNSNIDSVFQIYVDPSVVANAVDYLIEEATVSGGVSYVGSKPLDRALTPAPGWRQQSGVLGDGTAMTATYSVAINQQTAVNTAAATAIWAISANFQDSAFDRNETVLMAVTRLTSGNYHGQVLVPPASALVFSSAPSCNTAGVLQIPLTLFSRARVARLDMQPLFLV